VLGDVLVHELTAEHLRQFYAEFGKTHKPGTVRNMAGILSSALWLARKRNLLALNIAYDAADTVPALDVDGLQDDTAEHVWSAAEVIKVLAEAKRTSPQWHAFYAVMLDSGCRKGEINGLRWTDINFEAGTVSFKQQLLRVGPPPVFGVLKRGGHRIIDVAPETMDALKKHRRTQKALKLASGTKYQDHGLVFQKTAADVTAKPGDALGLPLVLEHNYEFKKMIARARVTAITFHQMRHTVASLLLGAGVPVHVVAKRLGHKDGITTLKVYAKCLPSDQAEASARLRERIYG
jgi:integrase